MEGGRLDPALVAGLLSSADPALKETASWIVGRHREWAGALAGVLGRRLDRADLPAAERAELEKQLGRLAQAAPIQQLLADRLKDASAPRAARQSSLQAMAWSGLNEKQVPARLDRGSGNRTRRNSRQRRASSACRGGRAQPARWPKDSAGSARAPLLRIAV